MDNVLPAQTLGPVGRALLVAGKLPILHTEQTDHAKSPPESVPVATTADYGAYLVSMGCKGCHGPALAGGPVATGDPDWPPASNLTPAGSLKDWSVDDFRRLLREGTRPGGVPVNVAMPWRSYRNMTDDEIQAIWLYLKTLPAVATPGIPAATN